MISESAYLIWKIRCERVIQMEGEEILSNKINNRWIESMNARLDLDHKMAQPKYEKNPFRKN